MVALILNPLWNLRLVPGREVDGARRIPGFRIPPLINNGAPAAVVTIGQEGGAECSRPFWGEVRMPSRRGASLLRLAILGTGCKRSSWRPRWEEGEEEGEEEEEVSPGR